VHSVSTDDNTQVDSILAKHADLLKPGLGKVEGIQAKLYLSPMSNLSFAENDQYRMPSRKISKPKLIDRLKLVSWSL
jgi:hypothetical protein